MGIITQRRRRERTRRMLRRAALAATAVTILLFSMQAARGALYACCLNAADAVWRAIQSAEQVFAGTQAAQAELFLPEREIYALQLAVFDSGERAAAQTLRMQTSGVKCIIWQGERLRIVSDASLERESLDAQTPQDYDTYVYQETLPGMTLRLEAGAAAIDDVRSLLMLPDSALVRLMDDRGEALPEIISQVRKAAETAAKAHPEHELYTQLAQSLVNWCDLMEADGETPRAYARATMGALCRELRRALSA